MLLYFVRQSSALPVSVCLRADLGSVGEQYA